METETGRNDGRAMKTDREIVQEAYEWWGEELEGGSVGVGVDDFCLKAIELARQYGALEPKPEIDWEKVRIDAAIAAMAALAPGNATGVYTYEGAAHASRYYADALVAELKREDKE